MEKRKFPRLPVTLFTQIQGTPRSFLCFSRNLSQNGLYLEAIETIDPKLLPPGKEVKVKFPIPLYPDPVEIPGQIVRLETIADPQGKAVSGIGMMFEDLKAATKTALAGYLATLENGGAAAGGKEAAPGMTFRPLGAQQFLELLKTLLLSKQREPTKDPFQRIFREQFAMLSSYDKNLLSEKLNSTSTLEALDIDTLFVIGRFKVETEKAMLTQVLAAGLQDPAQLLELAQRSLTEMIERIEPRYQEATQALVQEADAERLRQLNDQKSKYSDAAEAQLKMVEKAAGGANAASRARPRQADLKDLDQHRRELEQFLTAGRSAENPQLQSFLNVLAPLEKEIFGPLAGEKGLEGARHSVALLKKLASEVLYFKNADKKNKETQFFLRQCFGIGQHEYTLAALKLEQSKQAHPDKSEALEAIKGKLTKVLERLEQLHQELPKEAQLSEKEWAEIRAGRAAIGERQRATAEEETPLPPPSRAQRGLKYLNFGLVALLLALLLSVAASQITCKKTLPVTEISLILPAVSLTQERDHFQAVIRQNDWTFIAPAEQAERAKQFFAWAQSKKGKTATIKDEKGTVLYHTLCSNKGCFLAKLQ